MLPTFFTVGTACHEAKKGESQHVRSFFLVVANLIIHCQLSSLIIMVQWKLGGYCKEKDHFGRYTHSPLNLVGGISKFWTCETRWGQMPRSVVSLSWSSETAWGCSSLCWPTTAAAQIGCGIPEPGICIDDAATLSRGRTYGKLGAD